MDINQTLAFYDEDQRRTVQFPGMRRDATTQVVRQINLNAADSLVMYSRLDSKNADVVIDEQISFFEELGHDFEWKYYEHDTPPDLLSRLAAKGFEIGEVENIVALELEHLPDDLMKPPTHDVRRVTDPKQIDEIMIVQDEVWQTDENSLARRQLLFEMKNTPDSISIYVTYVKNRPVASAWIRFKNASPFASLWAGSTLPPFRHRGIYTEMLAIRAQEALARGTRFLTVDAGEMSLPILKKLGFQVLTLSNPCQWRSKRKNAILCERES